MYLRIKNRITKEFFSRLYHRQLSHINTTPAAQLGKRKFTLVSMVHHRDVNSYIAAVKSFIKYTKPNRIIVVCDPSINDDDRSQLKIHIPFIELKLATDFRHPDIPIGGTWERLFSISQFTSESYVIQLDADTLTLGDPTEVRDSINKNHGFVIGEEPGQRLTDFQRSHDLVKNWVEPDSHIQAISEWKLVSIGLPPTSAYVRGCSGFTGFPQNEEMKENLLNFSRRMGRAIGERWNDWGTEQVSSNYLVANLPGTIVLPYPKYCNPNHITENTVFAHFLGSQRFINRKYEKATKKIIELLKSET